ncbi:aldo/keto reductase [Labrys monachus]|uniref:D-threo-aldose 1-dehydrogenase n=1 Tax=Labrys monachus TaxID=217067 RepID=A0ABU0FBQ6_9HYPH|nr:aldo/keto reductase [Labrys monachus]MDQ0392053.1 D-threo-aldose 1-dehydrogenase [Labrys monachus]
MPVNLSDYRQLGSSRLKLPVLGFGSAHLGGMYNRVGGDVAHATLEAAWNGGVRYYDSAPYYGLGLSEHRVGSFLIDKPRDEFLVTTKVGRVLHRPADPRHFDRTPWGGGLNFEIEFNYSYDGFMRAYEQSLMRLALDTVDALLIHDLDAHSHGDKFAGRLKDLTDSGMKALEELKRSGDIKAIGMGINVEESLDNIAPLVDLDFVLVAMPYTLLDQGVLHTGLRRCVDRGIGVVIGAPFASGILATGPGPTARYRYGIAPEEIQDKTRRIEAVCRAHGVSLQAAALQFPLAHPAVASIIPGSARPQEVANNIASLQVPIPVALWADLRTEGLIDKDAPVPA